ncbi:MAG: PAS domain-containing protein, partial [Cellulosilyticaceae bacterium]
MKEQIYRRLIEESPIPYIGIKLIRDEGTEAIRVKILDVNKSFVYTFKKSAEELQKAHMHEKMAPDDYRDFLQKLQEADDDGHHIFRCDYKDGYVLNIEVYTFGADEYHLRVTRIGRRNNELGKLIEQSPFATWVKDRNGKYIEVNKQFLKIFNVTYDEVIGKCGEEIWEEHKAQHFNARHQQVIRENVVHRETDIINVPQLGERYFEMVRCPYTDETGNIILGVIGLAIEVTDKVKLRESIARNEKNFLDMANNIDELIIIRDEKKALYVSPYFETLYQFKPDALYEDMESWYKHWDLVEFLGEPEPYSCTEIDHATFRVVKHGVIDKWLQSKFVPIFDEHGNMIKKIGMIKDITDKKKIEDDIDNLRMEFFSNISHEFRTPIQIIMSALQMTQHITQKLDDEIREELHKYEGIIAQNGRRLIKLVNNLIDTTKINSGNFE